VKSRVDESENRVIVQDLKQIGPEIDQYIPCKHLGDIAQIFEECVLLWTTAMENDLNWTLQVRTTFVANYSGLNTAFIAFKAWIMTKTSISLDKSH